MNNTERERDLNILFGSIIIIIIDFLFLCVILNTHSSYSSYYPVLFKKGA